MHILIIGAGRIGTALAETLVNESNDITIVDTDGARLDALQKRFDLRTVEGSAISPEVLRTAQADLADIIIAVTASDETNMTVCMLAAHLFNIPTRIARVRNSELRNYPRLMAEEGFHITSSIWPEEALTESIVRYIEFPETLQILNFSDNKVALLNVRALAGAPLVGRPISDLSVHLPKISARIVSVFRRNRRLNITPDTVIESGDEVIALTAGRDIRRVISELRPSEDPFHNIVIAGDLYLALQLSKRLNDLGNFNIRVINENASACRRMADKFPNDVSILHANLLEEEDLEQIGISECDLFVALTPHDETNIMGCLLAKKMQARRAIALTESTVFSNLMQGSEVDYTVSTTQASIGELLRHVRWGDVVAAHSLRRGMSEALEIVAHGDRKSSRVVGKAISQIDLPSGVSIAAVVREYDGQDIVEMAHPNLVIEPEDHVIVFVPNKRVIPKIESLFAVDVGFF